MTLRVSGPGALSLFFGALLTGLLVWQLPLHSPAHDEPIHLVSGLRMMKTGELIDATHPPLAFVFQALPLLAMNVDLRLHDDSWTRELSGHYYVDVLTKSGTRFETILMAGRIGAIVISLLLAWLIYQWSLRLWGPWGAALSLGLAALSPMLLADGALVGNDIAIAAGALLTLAAFRRYVFRPGRTEIVLLAAAFAGSLLVKFSAVVLVPAVLLLYVFKRFLERRNLSAVTAPGPARVLRDFVIIAGLSLIAVWAAYGFEIGAVAKDPMLSGSRGGALAKNVLSQFPAWLPTLPIPAYSFWKGLALQAFHSANHAAWDPVPNLFLMGKYAANGWWYYFPVAFAVKTPLALVILVAGLLVAVPRMMRRPSPDTASPAPTEMRFELALILVPSVLWMIACMGITINIGVRYLMPVYALLFILAGGVAWALPHLEARQRMKGRAVVALLLGWYAVGSIAVLPHSHAYFNEIAGGPDGGWRVLNNSSLDWGQDLFALRAFLKEEHIDRPYVDVFGVLQPEHVGIDAQTLPREKGALDAVTGTVIVSATRLTTKDRNEPLYSRLRAATPRARIGHAIFVYDVAAAP